MIPIHFVQRSSNQKLGPIPATTLGRQGCPTSCAFYGNGCYGDSGPVQLHWRKVTSGERDLGLEETCRKISELDPGQIWRHAVVGDVTDQDNRVDRELMGALTQANAGRPVIGFTHADPAHADNLETLLEAAKGGFTLNLSANSLEHADHLSQYGLPVVTVLPKDAPRKLKTPEGRAVATCPATYLDDVTCAKCRLCATPWRKAIVGFPAHGSGWKKVDLVARRQA